MVQNIFQSNQQQKYQNCNTDVVQTTNFTGTRAAQKVLQFDSNAVKPPLLVSKRNNRNLRTSHYEVLLLHLAFLYKSRYASNPAVS